MLITMQSSLATPIGYIQPDIYIAENEKFARQYAFSNFTISTFEDLTLEKYRYFIRLKDGVKEIYPVSWDSETGIKTFRV